MKCPKCEYLGFETGDRCKNCGYDFSLAVTAAAAPDRELPLREPEPFQRDADRWLNQLEARLDTVKPAASANPDPVASMPLAPDPPVVRQIAPRDTPNLPLFHPGSADLDEPLIKVPSAPRAPLSVRRTPDRPKLRTMPKPVNRIFTGKESEPVLAFADEPAVAPPPPRRVESTAPAQTPATKGAIVETSGPARRITAAVVDLVILLAIDAVVVYFTFQIAGLPFSDWQSVPIVPLALFLLMVKGSYFSVFTALGGQTVGKMAMGIRVVAEDDREVEPSRAVQRTLAALASVATAGIGFAPVLFAADRRALHDRVAGTRVVGPHHE
jgi:uncharacterized RDD family membrane protein YckC